MDFYPVRGPHDHGYDSPATGDSNRWTCDGAHSNSDYIKANNRHLGNDVWAAEGTPVVAVSAGKVGSTKCETGPGCNTGFTDACGWYHWVGHLQRIADGIAEGVRVEAGTVIGYVGKSGTYSNGVVHLHYSIHSPGNYYTGIDPWPYLHAAEKNVCDSPAEGPSLAFLNARSSDVDGDGLSDVCARGITGVRCWPSSTSGWHNAWEPIPWSDASGWDQPEHYGTLRMGDLNGDGLSDVCGRAASGVYCALSNGHGFAESTPWQAQLTNKNGWDHPSHYNTLRIVDVNGDGKDDLCARDASGFGCWLSDGNRFARRVEGPRWSNEAGFSNAPQYGTIRMGDVDGDGLVDACARTSAGIRCALATQEGFGADIVGPDWSDAQGFDRNEYWSTLRLADVNGDEKADLCIRTATDFRCHLSLGNSFGEALVVAELSDASGWSDPSNYQTFRSGDVNGDGAIDLCVRSNSAIVCWVWNGVGFESIAGPEWSDANGWSGATHFDTIRLVDFNGDDRADLCARADSGWRCHPSLGDAFGNATTLDELTNGGGWGSPKYSETIMSASRESPPTTEPPITRTDQDAGREADTELSSDSGVRPDGGPQSDTTLPANAPLTNLCTCSAMGRDDIAGHLWVLAVLGFLRSRQRRG